MLKVVQAYDQALIAEIETDGSEALERKLQAAEQVFKNRDGWLKPHQRSLQFNLLQFRLASCDRRGPCPRLPGIFG